MIALGKNVMVKRTGTTQQSLEELAKDLVYFKTQKADRIAYYIWVSSRTVEETIGKLRQGARRGQREGNGTGTGTGRA